MWKKKGKLGLTCPTYAIISSNCFSYHLRETSDQRIHALVADCGSNFFKVINLQTEKRHRQADPATSRNLFVKTLLKGATIERAARMVDRLHHVPITEITTQII